MIKAKQNYQTIDEYIENFPDDIQKILQKIRKTIKKAAPNTEEVISYQIPAFKQNSVLVYFAAFKDHIGFFPTAKPIEVFKDKLTAYKTSKGTIQFPLDKKMPLNLITEITKFRLKEDLQKQKAKK
jgi:uncharacterized protein YdhG (YjbR/CyaY superfamily)